MNTTATIVIMFVPIVIGIIAILLWVKTIAQDVKAIRAEMFCKRDRTPRKPRAKPVQGVLPLPDMRVYSADDKPGAV